MFLKLIPFKNIGAEEVHYIQYAKSICKFSLLGYIWFPRYLMENKCSIGILTVKKWIRKKLFKYSFKG